ncbi:MAG TPA: YtxH domain-containing protein [Cyclobacteriaceae bacterium]|nr:YtxH domain-containing protein [Cyclobacteriaceae bacterium]
MKTTNVIMALAAAAVAGAAIGMLLAPEKGTDLQKKLKDEANRWIDEVKKLVNTGRELKANVEDEMDEIKSNLNPIEN